MYKRKQIELIVETYLPSYYLYHVSSHSFNGDKITGGKSYFPYDMDLDVWQIMLQMEALLNPKEEFVLRSRYVDCLFPEEIADILRPKYPRITPIKVEKIIDSSFRKLCG